MQINAVDNEKNLFRVIDVFPAELVEKVIATDWLNLPWQRQEGQERWSRRRIDLAAIPWIKEWDLHMSETVWPELIKQTGLDLQPYTGTAFWLDEPGFTCSMHTDGELPASLHLTWFGSEITHGTAFYWYKDPESLRYQVPMQPNAGYIMINQPDAEGYRKLLWHAMLTPVPKNSFRLTSYTWITPK